MKTTHIISTLLTALALTACGAEASGVDETPDVDAAPDASGSSDVGVAASGVDETPDVDAAPDAYVSSDVGVADDADDGSEDDANTQDAGPLELPSTIGTESRPAKIYFPPDYAGEDVPLVFLLHGYTASGSTQELYFGLRRLVAANRFIYVIPEGTKDSGGNQHWNATEACCAFLDKSIDDSGYLRGLIDEVTGSYGVSGVYFMGHSNGGFMSYRMACEHSDVVDGVLSLAGATYDDPADCAPDDPVKIIQVHGTADATILYEGGLLGTNVYPSAEGTASRWAKYGGCDETSTPGAPLDLMPNVPAVDDAETTRDVWANCDSGARAELWSVPLGSHIPTFTRGFGQIFYDELITK